MPSAALIKSSSSPEVGGGVGCLISPRAASVHTYSPIGISLSPHKLLYFEMQLWISEQRHQSQFLLIFIERSGSRCHLYIREPAVINRSCGQGWVCVFYLSQRYTRQVQPSPCPSLLYLLSR